MSAAPSTENNADGQPTVDPPLRWLENPSSDASLIRTAFSRFPSGVVAICAVVDGEYTGMVASSFSVGASFDPPVVMFAVQNSSTTWPRLRTCAAVGVSVLAREHEAIVAQLASRRGDRFAGLDVSETTDGGLLIRGASMWLDCSIMSETPAGDHQVVLLQVNRLNTSDDIAPLVYHDRRFHELQAPAADA